jgi:hypothetical protein
MILEGKVHVAMKHITVGGELFAEGLSDRRLLLLLLMVLVTVTGDCF